MSNDEASTPAPLLVPSPQEPDLVKAFLPLRDVPQLFVPMGTDGGGAVEVDEETRWLALDQVFIQRDEGERFALLFSDRGLFREWTQYLSVDTEWALRRLFEDRHMDGVVFNLSCAEPRDDQGTPNFSKETQGTCFIPRDTLAEILGLLRSPDPLAQVLPHMGLAAEALKRDDPYVTYLHAGASWDHEGQDMDTAAYLLDAIIALGLARRAYALVRAAQELDGNDVRPYLYNARLLTLAGKPEDALAQIEALPVEKTGALGRLEKGRALSAAERYEEGQPLLREVLERDPEDVESLLALGVSLRNQHYKSGDPEGLSEAQRCFEKVAKAEGYHACEALHHLVTVFFGLNRMEEALPYAERCLATRDNGVARRNLIFILHSLGRLEEARRHAGYLRMWHPEEAPALEKLGL